MEIQFVSASKKPRKCCVANCPNRYTKMHRFPKNEPHILKAWIQRIKPPNFETLTVLQIYNRYYVCEEHFAEDCLVEGTKRGLRRDAIPSLNIPGFQENVSSGNATSDREEFVESPMLVQQEEENEDVTLDNANFEEVQIPVPWGHITGKWWGSRDCQPIIAIHGWQDNAGTFDNLAPLLEEKGLSVYCIDLPGHGFSSHLPTGQKYYLFWDGIHHLRRIVKHFNWTNITILGHSLGGIIAFLYAAAYPDQVKKYISIDTATPVVRNPKTMVDNLGDGVDKFLKYDRLVPDKMPCYDYDDMLEMMVRAHAGSVDRVGCEILMKRAVKPAKHEDGYVFTRDPRLKVGFSLGFLGHEQTLELASRIKCEVMNIRATNGLKLDKPEYYDLVLDTVEKHAKKLERCTFEGTHHIHLNDAEFIAPSICNFLLS